MKRFNLAVRTSVSLAALAMGLGSAAIAQDAEPEAEEGEFLGTITLGESKREVQTDTATPVTIIDRTEIRDRQATTIAELIDSAPGVSLVNGSTPGGSGINIRGFGANGTFGTDQLVAVFIDHLAQRVGEWVRAPAAACSARRARGAGSTGAGR